MSAGQRSDWKEKNRLARKVRVGNVKGAGLVVLKHWPVEPLGKSGADSSNAHCGTNREGK